MVLEWARTREFGSTDSVLCASHSQLPVMLEDHALNSYRYDFRCHVLKGIKHGFCIGYALSRYPVICNYIGSEVSPFPLGKSELNIVLRDILPVVTSRTWCERQ